ncbi:hypothetical protein [Burkholderia ubonensis]|uniref:hypothetical protein n=1 Tax=Burkholderia ubonensis TaxID=101571 RepID=UPI000754A224|nr:hypothetical protein [Burkholderia ubonensis]
MPRILDSITLICWFLRGTRTCAQIELDRIFAVLRDKTKLVRTVNAQAFSTARQHLLFTGFDDLNARLLTLVEQNFGVPPLGKLCTNPNQVCSTF